ncbi:MAG: hypothetical protein U0792_17905 [Gemmataceae bacterium]
MAKTRAKKPTAPPTTAEKSQATELLDPKRMHELLGIHGPYDPPPPPVPTKGYVTFWDPGASIHELVRKRRELFYLRDHDGEYAKRTDLWKWRQIRLTPIEPNLTFAEQTKQLSKGDEPAAARELVTFLVLHFLTTGERFEMERWRCKDVSESRRHCFVGPFSPLGLDIGNVSDEWTSPGICLSVMSTPIKRKK